MSFDRRRLDDLFDEVYGKPAAEREAFLQKLGIAEPALALALRQRLGECGSPPRSGFLDELHAGFTAAARLAIPIPEGTCLLDRYTVIKRLGGGGMAEIYQVREHKFDRVLALKMIGFSLVGHREAERRFEAEARLTAKLQHPNIVPVHDFGRLDEARERRLYYAMEQVEGATLRSILRDASADPAGRLAKLLDIFEKICAALAFAHSREEPVVHRDLKPDNVMVGRFDDVQVLDWGIAKLLGRQAVEVAPDTAMGLLGPNSNARADGGGTAAGTILGTVSYMAPEQMRGEAERVGKAADVFALGALLCEVLTGCPPYQHPEDSPADPSLRGRIEALVNGDALWPGLERLAGLNADPEFSPHRALAKLAGECLARDPALRPPDAAAVAQRIAAYQAATRKEAENARIKDAKLVEERKKRRFARLLALALGVLLFGAVGAALYFNYLSGENKKLAELETTARAGEEKERKNAQASAKQALRTLARQYVREGNQPLEAGNNDNLGQLPWFAAAYKIDEQDPRLSYAHRLRLQAALNSGPALLQTVFARRTLTSITFTPDGRHVVTTSGVFPHKKPLRALALRRDAEKNPDLLRGDNCVAQAWEVRTGQACKPMPHEVSVGLSAVSPEGFLFTVDDRYRLRVWEYQSGRLIHGPEQLPKDLLPFHMESSPDGRHLLVSSYGGKLQLWNVAPTGLLKKRQALDAMYGTFSPDGRRLAVIGDRGEKVVGKTLTRKVATEVWALPPEDDKPPTAVRAWENDAVVHSYVAFNSDGTRIVTVGSDSRVTVWDIATGKAITTLDHQGVPLTYAAFSPDGERLLTSNCPNPLQFIGAGTGDPAVVAAWVWDVRTRRVLTQVPTGNSTVVTTRLETIRLLPDGARLLGMGTDDGVEIGALRGDTSTIFRHGLAVTHSALDRTGHLFATGSEDGMVRVWALESREPLTRALELFGGKLKKGRFSPDGRYLVTTDESNTIRCWDTTTGRGLYPVLSTTIVSRPGRDSFATFSSDGKQLCVVNGERNTALLVEVPSGKLLYKFESLPFAIRDATFSPRTLVLGGASQEQAKGKLVLWDLEKRTRRDIDLMDAPGTVKRLCFGADGRQLAVVHPGGLLRVWDPGAGKPLTEVLKFTGEITLARFSPDGNRLAVVQQLDQVAGQGNWSVSIWDTVANRLLHNNKLFHGDVIEHLAFSPDNKWLVTASRDMTARVWEVDTGGPVARPLKHTSAVLKAVFDPTGRVVATAEERPVYRVWEAGTGDPVSPPLGVTARPCEVAMLSDATLITLDEQGTLNRWSFADPGGSAQDWLRRARLLSGFEIDPDGGKLPLPRQSQLANWDEFRRAEDGKKTANLPSINGSMLRLAVMHRLAADWRGSVWHLDRLIQQNPQERTLRFLRGRQLLELGAFAAACDDLDEAMRLGLDDVEVACAGALSQLAAGRKKEYQIRCERLLAAYGKRGDAEFTRLVAWVCTLQPNAVSDTGQLVRLARRALADDLVQMYETKFPRLVIPSVALYRGSLGAALFRDGKYKEAVGELEKSLASDNKNGYMLAMAYHHLDQPAEARRWLADTISALNNSPRMPDSRELTWSEQLVRRMLREEAEALIQGR